MQLNNKKGIALVFSLMITVVLLGLSSMFIARTIGERNMSKRERGMGIAFSLSEAAAHNALETIDTFINQYLYNLVTDLNPTTVINNTNSYYNNQDGVGFLVNYVRENGEYAGTQLLTLDGSQGEYNSSNFSLNGGTYNFRIVFTEKEDPVKLSDDEWDFPYNYRIKATGNFDGVIKELILSGDFIINIQRDSFAKYALFTNSQSMPSGSNVWFKDTTNFAGPVHTNDRFNFYGNPGGTFEGTVEQVQQTARFYNGGSSVLLDDDNNGTTDVPVFNEQFNRGVGAITLSSSVQMQDMIDQASGGESFGSDGVYVPNNGGALTGGIYVRGNGNITVGVNGSNQPTYTVQQGSTTKVVTLNKSSNQTTVETVGGSTTTYSGLPDGVEDVGTIIFVDGSISSLGGTVQQNEQLTIASDGDVVINNHLVYSNYTAGVGTPGTVGYVPPHADGADNLLGLVSWNGDVVIGNSAPDDLNVHGTIMTQNGILTVDDYDDQGVGPRGAVTLLGGVLQDNYGAFGTFSGSTGNQLSGYGRNFVYDERMRTGNAPPYFPSMNTFIAFTNDITDKIVWTEGGL